MGSLVGWWGVTQLGSRGSPPRTAQTNPQRLLALDSTVSVKPSDVYRHLCLVRQDGWHFVRVPVNGAAIMNHGWSQWLSTRAESGLPIYDGIGGDAAFEGTRLPKQRITLTAMKSWELKSFSVRPFVELRLLA